jgi:hypothetical protein
MALTKEDLEALGSFIETKVKDIAGDMIATRESENAQQTADNAVQNRVSVVGKPDVDPEAGPKYYVHLADGSVLQTFDAGSTHMANDAGEQMAVIGRYQMGVNS